jgi:hypothetical protein
MPVAPTKDGEKHADTMHPTCSAVALLHISVRLLRLDTLSISTKKIKN